MTVPKINSAHGSDTRNIINRAIDSTNEQGKAIQNLVAKGQLTPTQYEQLLYSVNSLLKNGDVDKYALSESLRKELEAIKDASPKGVYETLSDIKNDYPNGSDGIYLASDNGNWYFWNGSNWESGGVYQGKTLSENEIEKVAEVAQILNQGYQGLEAKHESFVNKAGNVKDGTFNPPGGSNVYRGSITFIDNNNTFIPKRLHSKIMVFKRNDNESSYPYFLTRVLTGENIINGFWIKKSDIVNLPSSTKISLQLESRDSSNTSTYGDVRINKEQMLSIGFESSANVGEDSILVKVEREYEGWIYYIARNENPVSGQSRAAIRFAILDLPAGESGKLQILNYSMITGASEILPHFVYPSNEKEVAKTTRELSQLVYEIDSGITSEWKGKKWSVLGDSNSYNSGVKLYHSFISEKTGVIVDNKAVGGTGWIHKGTDGSRANILEQINLADINSDLITVLAGGNDYSVGYPLGNINDKTMDTFYGALNLCVEALIDKFPLKTIAVITQLPRASENASGRPSVEQQVNATIEVCRKFSIPVLDLYHHGNIYPRNSTYRAEAIPDGVHLSTLGQEMMSHKIQHFLEEL